MEGRIEPLSYNTFVETYGGGIEEFSLHCLRYWLQQNAHRADEKEYIKLRGLLPPEPHSTA